MGSMSLMHWLVVLGVALLLFGNRLPTIGKSLGSGIRNFKSGLSGDDEVSEGSDDPKQVPGSKSNARQASENSKSHQG